MYYAARLFVTQVIHSYAMVKCADESLVTDVLFALTPKIQSLTARHVACLCWSFGHLRLTHVEFFNALASHAVQVASTFSANDIPKAILGFGLAGIRNDEVFRVLWDEVSGVQRGY